MFFFFLTTRRLILFFFFFSSRRRHTRFSRDWSSDVCSSDLLPRLCRGQPIWDGLTCRAQFCPSWGPPLRLQSSPSRPSPNTLPINCRKRLRAPFLRN